MVRIMAIRGDLAQCLAQLDNCGAEPELVALCKRCLAYQPADRPRDASALAEEVASLRAATEERARAAYLEKAAVERLTAPEELELLKRLALYPRTVEAAASAHEPHRIAFYLYDLASEFHALWTRGRDLPYLRFIITNDAEITKARLAMVQGVVSVLASGLAVLGVHAPDEMR